MRFYSVISEFFRFCIIKEEIMDVKAGKYRFKEILKLSG